MALMVLCWVAGFDIIYALQDEQVDRRDGLHSVPARFGSRNALLLSRLLHALSAAAIVGVAVVDPRFGLIFSVAVGLIIALLLYEHATVARWGTSRLALAFFTLNGAISCALGLAGVVDVLT